MNRLCEQCGSDNAKLYCRWPAVLCAGCAEKRSTSGEAEATSEAKEAPLYSLADLHRRRTSLARRGEQLEPVGNVQNSAQNDNPNVRHAGQIKPSENVRNCAQTGDQNVRNCGQIEPSENVQHAEQIGDQNVRNCEQIEPPEKPKPIVAMETLAQMDEVFKVALRLNCQRSHDAVHIAKGLLCALLRLACAKAQNKPRANPEPAAVPLKLFAAGVIDKPTMQRFKKTIASGPAGDVLACCRELFAWLSGDAGAKIERRVKQ